MAILGSIILATYNRSAFLAEAIESALAQGPEFEVIVVDDGSTDDTPRIIERYPAVRSVKTENRGPAAARNLGLTMASGSYVRFHDSDDRIPFGALSKLLETAKTLGEEQVAIGDAILIDERGDPGKGPTYGFAAIVPPGAIPPSVLLSNVMATPLPLFPKSALQEFGGFDENLTISEDYELAIRLAANGVSFVRVPIIVCEVREHEGGRASRGYGAPGYQQQLKALVQSWARWEQRQGANNEDRAAIGRMAWSLGRSASRESFRAEADALFAFANAVGGLSARPAPWIVQVLSMVLSPYHAERLLEAMKSARKRTARTQ